MPRPRVPSRWGASSDSAPHKRSSRISFVAIQSVQNAEANMRQLLVTIICAAGLYSQPSGGAPFGGLTADASSRKPVGACRQLRSLTSLELSVIGATVIAASAGVPEHCRVSLMAQPEVNIEV